MSSLEEAFQRLIDQAKTGGSSIKQTVAPMPTVQQPHVQHHPIQQPQIIYGNVPVPIPKDVAVKKPKTSILKWVIIGSLVIVVVIIVAISIRRMRNTTNSCVPQTSQEWKQLKIDPVRYRSILKNSQRVPQVNDAVRVPMNHTVQAQTHEQSGIKNEPGTNVSKLPPSPSPQQNTGINTMPTQVVLPTQTTASHNVVDSQPPENPVPQKNTDPNFTPLDQLE